MKLHYNIRVIGKVQGVWFRASAEIEARNLGLKGFVCNEGDGSVYIEAEGEKERLDKFVKWCWKGPERALVADVQITEGHLKNFEKFEIKKG